MRRRQTPHEKFAVECRALLERWDAESDMDELGIADIAQTVISDWLDEPVVGFEPDPDLLSDDEGSPEP